MLDPFAGSSTTGIAASLAGRRYLGIEQEQKFLEMSRLRRQELENPSIRAAYRDRIADFRLSRDFDNGVAESEGDYRPELPII